MCGIVGLFAHAPVNQDLFDALTVLQHRGQDAAGIMTCQNGQLFLRKGNGLIRDVMRLRHMQRLQGNIGIGHVRYPTAGNSSEAQAQPFYVNSPYGITLAHNGNLTNAQELSAELFRTDLRHINTTSDSEVLLNVFAHELQTLNKIHLEPKDIFKAVSQIHKRVKGAYAAVAMVVNHGLIAFRDPHGIRPLVYGERETVHGKEYMVASESVALDTLEFTNITDVAPGEAIYIDLKGQLHKQQCAEHFELNPCVFEFVYLARPDSMVDGISVYHARMEMGQRLAEKIKREWPQEDIDVIIPIPDTGRTMALPVANALNIPFREAFIKNRYIGRTFIMPGQSLRKKSVRKKLNPIDLEFKDKNVLLIDDSIVRGTTSKQIVAMARKAGARKVYFASAAPAVRFPNVYGIDMPARSELIAYNRTVEEVCEFIGADKLIYTDIADLIAALKVCNPNIKRFDTSVFDGEYITGDITEAYLDALEKSRSDLSKQSGLEKHSSVIDLGNTI
ncbi:MAG: amidophosphoribosyltransferase [Legionellales bacterium]|jgi:amidophosphoribosyltransferase